jgi:hypothetical protein
MQSDGGQVTQLLKAMRGGAPQASQELTPLEYAEPHRLAKSYMRERPFFLSRNAATVMRLQHTFCGA